MHVGSHCSLSGSRGRVLISDCVSLSTRVTIFTGTDSYSEDYLNGPLVPVKYVKTKIGDVSIGRGVVVGAHTVILPGVEIGEASSVGAMCVLNRSCKPGSVVITGAGRPRMIRSRNVAAIVVGGKSVFLSIAIALSDYSGNVL